MLEKRSVSLFIDLNPQSKNSSFKDLLPHRSTLYASGSILITITALTVMGLGVVSLLAHYGVLSPSHIGSIGTIGAKGSYALIGGGSVLFLLSILISVRTIHLVKIRYHLKREERDVLRLQREVETLHAARRIVSEMRMERNATS